MQCNVSVTLPFFLLQGPRSTTPSQAARRGCRAYCTQPSRNCSVVDAQETKWATSRSNGTAEQYSAVVTKFPWGSWSRAWGVAAMMQRPSHETMWTLVAPATSQLSNLPNHNSAVSYTAIEAMICACYPGTRVPIAPIRETRVHPSTPENRRIDEHTKIDVRVCVHLRPESNQALDSYGYCQAHVWTHAAQRIHPLRDSNPQSSD